MKGKADLVEGWLRKAASDLRAIRASAAAGSLDVACFHAQQAAEKYLKAYLVDRDQEILHSHNIHKLLALCGETNPAFKQLLDAADLLTPFAVEARYDTEFWPSSETVEQAILASNRIRDLVASLVQSTVDPAIALQWQQARDAFNWRVDLRHFKDAGKYPGFFDRVIEPAQTEPFEAAFRAELNLAGKVERASEVLFWKNYGNYKARDRISRFLFEWIDSSPQGWGRFVEALKKLADQPTWELYQSFIGTCGMTSGFATPLTFLSFCDPQRFPMIDRKIGAWWSRRFPDKPAFTWNPSKTVVTPTKQSFEAYLAWAGFCRQQAAELTRLSGRPWRARDVEMAVWVDEKAELPLT